MYVPEYSCYDLNYFNFHVQIKFKNKSKMNYFFFEKKLLIAAHTISTHKTVKKSVYFLPNKV
jgi:hypothetical protein